MKKGLVSFEFMIPLAAIVLLTAALIPGILEESRETIIQSSVKSSITSEISNEQFESPQCQNPYIEAYSVIQRENAKELRFNILPEECILNEEKIIQITSRIEEEICGSEPMPNNEIRCGDTTYEVTVE